VLNIFYNGSKRNEWTSIPNIQIEGFFRLVSLILADHIRQIIIETALDFVAMFDSMETIISRFKISHSHPVTFTMRPILDGKRIKLEPLTAEVESTLMSLLELILIAADKIPKIETQLFATSQTQANNNNRVGMNPFKPEQCISINFELTYPTFCENIRKTLKNNLAKCMQAPHNYLNEYDKLAALIEKRLEVDVIEFVKVTTSQEKMIEVWNFLMICRKLNFIVRWQQIQFILRIRLLLNFHLLTFNVAILSKICMKGQ
jgi:dynein heavy chain